MIREAFVKTLPPDGRLDYRPALIAPQAADDLLDCLAREIDWQQRTLKIFGKTLPQPRRVCFMGDPGVDYSYSGDRHRAADWHPAVAVLREVLVGVLGVSFNCVLLNAYRSGDDCMGWHADDEPELGTNPVIASISLGAVRRFRLRARREHSRALTLEPAHGSLLVMAGDLQHHWQHQLPRTRRKVGLRINLTFRRILPDRRNRR
ncbi:MAG: alpha-ketoglutarate-dependent dioxygenase AlkB [Wenzhouxiangellaceae bacterium]|nr:alpha-ketoglutarate-dependent dioxygenase AlkB [Wenzhouxiangellaceae bacterium]